MRRIPACAIIPFKERRDRMKYEKLESERLVLVKPEECHAEEILRAFDRETTRYMCPKADETMEEVLGFLNFVQKGIEEMTSYNYALIVKETGEFIGCGGIENVQGPIAEFGIWIKKEAYHHGYGREAVRCLYEAARTCSEYEGFIYPVDRRNLSSRRIAEALGGVCDETDVNFRLNGNGQDLELITYHIRK